MQVGGKPDEVGWAAYEMCRQGGAIVATAHEHSYSRTLLLSNFAAQTVVPSENKTVLKLTRGKNGNSFAFVSGLGGMTLRFEDPYIAQLPYWGSIYTSTQDANFGVLFCVFNEHGVVNRAHCYFKNIDGKVVDEFIVLSPEL